LYEYLYGKGPLLKSQLQEIEDFKGYYSGFRATGKLFLVYV